MSTTIMSSEVQHVASHAWDGAANNSQSVEYVDGVESRRNLVTNPSFNAALTNWNTSSTAYGTHTRDTTVFHSGVASMKFTSAVNAQSLGGGYGPAIPIVPGESYTLSFWAMVPTNLTATYTTTMAFYDAAGAYLGVTYAMTALTTATDWTRISMLLNVPDGAASMRLTLLNSLTTRATVAEVIYVDDVMVETASEALPYFDGDTPPEATYATSTPLLVDGWEESVETRNVVNNIVGGGIDITPYPADPRSGQYVAVFQDEDEAAALVQMHTKTSVFFIQDDERPSIGMNYVPNGTITRALDDDSREFWLVTIPFQEVGA